MLASGPKYQQIARVLRKRILDGDLAVGDLIPSEQDLAAKHGVSRMTARQAVTLLVDQGYLRREHGRGTFVAERKVVRGLSSVTGLREDLEKEGLTPGGKVLSVQSRVVGKAEADRLRIPRSNLVWELVRARTADGVTIALQRVIIPIELVPDLREMDLANKSFYAQLRDRGLPLTWAKQRIEAVVDASVSAQLELPSDTAYLRVTRVSSGPDKRPVELLVSYFVGTSYAYDVELA